MREPLSQVGSGGSCHRRRALKAAGRSYLRGPVLNSARLCRQTGSEVAANWFESDTGTTMVSFRRDALTRLGPTVCG